MSLRTKQALILFVATVLPFLLGAGAMNLAVAPAYRREVFRGAEETAQRLSDHVAWNLARDVGRLDRLATWGELRMLIRDARAPEEAADIERRWAALGDNSEPLRRIFSNPVSDDLVRWEQTDPEAAVLFATDAHGQVVAASHKPEAYRFSEHRWWQSAFAGGKGSVFVSDVRYDQTVRSWVVSVAVPVYADGTARSRAIGVLQESLDVARTFEDIQRVSSAEGNRAFLIDRFGRIIVSPSGGKPLASILKYHSQLSTRSQQMGSVEAGAGGGTAVYAWSQVPLARQIELAQARAPILFVVTQSRGDEAFAPLKNVQRWMIVICIATIALAVALGYFLADRWLVRDVRKLAEGMRLLARGDFDGAAVVADELTHHGTGSADGRRDTAEAERPPADVSR